MCKSVYDYPLTDIRGNLLDLSSFKGKKILIVNTASACGFTPQYKQLEELQQNFEDKVQVIALPCNDFGGQEPGSEIEIEQFCHLTFKVSFPLTSKVNILGSNPHPLYNFLMKKNLNGLCDSEVEWNFQKYLVDENGKLIKVFSSATEPLSEEILSIIENR